MKSRDESAHPKNGYSNKQELYEGYAGEKCTKGDILIAANAMNALNDGDKNAIGAQIINGLRKDIKWGCAPENIKGPVNPQAAKPNVASSGPVKVAAPAKAAALARAAAPAKAAAPVKAATPTKAAAPKSAAPAKSTATSAKVTTALKGKLAPSRPAPASKTVVKPHANPTLLKREKQQNALHLAKATVKAAPPKAAAPKPAAPARAVNGNQASYASTHSFYESRDGGRCSTDGGNVSACGRDVTTGSSSMDRDHSFGSRGWR